MQVELTVGLTRRSYAISRDRDMTDFRSANRLFYKITGSGEPLLLLHGLLATGAAGEIGLNKMQVTWLRALMGTNRAPAMRGAVRGLITIDSRPWLREIRVPTLVVGGTHDTAVPQHHFDSLVNNIPGARGLLIERAGHTLM